MERLYLKLFNITFAFHLSIPVAYPHHCYTWTLTPCITFSNCSGCTRFFFQLFLST